MVNSYDLDDYDWDDDDLSEKNYVEPTKVFTRQKILSGCEVEFYVTKEGEVTFEIDQSVVRAFDDKDRHPGIAKFVLKSFLEAKEEFDTLWTTALDDGIDTDVRSRAYEKFFPNEITTTESKILFIGEQADVLNGIKARYPKFYEKVKEELQPSNSTPVEQNPLLPSNVMPKEGKFTDMLNQEKLERYLNRENPQHSPAF